MESLVRPRPVTVPAKSPWCIRSQPSLSPNLGDCYDIRRWLFLNFQGKKMKAERSEVTCPKSYNWPVAERIWVLSVSRASVLAMGWIFLSRKTPKLMPKMRVLGDGALGRRVAYKRGGLVTEMSALITATPETKGPFPYEKTAVFKEAGSHQRPGLPPPWSWNSQLPELWEVNICCFIRT